MAEPRVIDADGKQVVVKLMDDSWTFNQCVSAHPFQRDNFRNSDAEQREKEGIVRKLRASEIDARQYAYRYDLARNVR